MDTQTLKTFLTLANVKNFTQTARLMYIAQSTVCLLYTSRCV